MSQNLNEAVFLIGFYIDQKAVTDFAIELVRWSSNQQNNGRPVRFNINSQGGNILDALALYEEFNRLRTLGHKVTIAAYGRCASCAGWLIQAADVRIMGSQSWINVHEVSSAANGPLSLMKREVARCEELQDQTFGIISARCPELTRERLNKETADGRDWWLNARTAKELGLVDIIEEVKPFEPVAA